jgi:hypothetical protein
MNALVEVIMTCDFTMVIKQASDTGRKWLPRYPTVCSPATSTLRTAAFALLNNGSSILTVSAAGICWLKVAKSLRCDEEW